MANKTYKEWNVECSLCGHKNKVFGWSDELPFKCQGECGSNNYMPVVTHTQTVMIATDDFPGGFDVKHGICHDDGSPRKVYSKTELKRELNRKGYTIGGDTPKPYKVHWEGKRD